MKQVWLYILATALGLAGCDVGDRKEAAAIYKANTEAAKQCEAKLKGLKRVPIARMSGKLFLDAERLPMWAISRGFSTEDDCGANGLQESESFYWTGDKFIPQYIWLWKDGHTLVEAARHQDWIMISADVYFGIPGNCKSSPTPTMQCGEKPPDKDEAGVIRLKNHPIDAWPARDPKLGGRPIYFLSLRDWPKENGWPRTMRLSCEIEGSVSEIENLEFGDKPGICQIDFYDFKFKAGSARINFAVKDLDRITPVLQAFQKYLNDSIIEKE